MENKIELRDLYDAVVTFNGDPFLIETEEEAEEMLKYIENSNRAFEITDKDEFDIACRRLDFTDKQPNKIYQFDNFIVCFAWDINY